MEELPDQLKDVLLGLAREALNAAALRQPLPQLDLRTVPEPLQKQAASFVTLILGEKLRGCIGSLEARMPLAEDVRHHAFAAALHDARFPPVEQEEVPSIRIEISILSQPKELKFEHADQLVTLLRPGLDGVIVEEGKSRATFLPQVWNRIPSPPVFLSMLCEKAGLQPDRWKSGKLRVHVYEANCFLERNPNTI